MEDNSLEFDIPTNFNFKKRRVEEKKRRVEFKKISTKKYKDNIISLISKSTLPSIKDIISVQCYIE